ncbi:MAG TPA: hypothetical protein VFE47_08015 [Tepidisphaeraceae bacterium]|jgi:hypothetical protein|nr:hypothetical protein [Tepidisphaeraceae bacterium]
MNISHRYKVIDDSGYIGLFDPDAYVAFVSEEWTLPTLVARFKREIGAGHLLLWGTGMENFWKVKAQLGFSRRKGFREVLGSIDVSQSRLCLTSYDSLTMGAQFEDVKLPQRHELQLIVPVPSGKYECRVVQLNDPDALVGETAEDQDDFLVELRPRTVADKIATWKSIPWGDLG